MKQHKQIAAHETNDTVGTADRSRGEKERTTKGVQP